jgi:hypothetical protein
MISSSSLGSHTEVDSLQTENAMGRRIQEEMALSILRCICEASKPLLWLKDEDPLFTLVPSLRKPIGAAFDTVSAFPHALACLQRKLCSTYDWALRESIVGTGVQHMSSRCGKRTAQKGRKYSLEYAKKRRDLFFSHAQRICSSRSFSRSELFQLAGVFIDYLDWGEFTLENPRGQAMSLLLEAVELLDATRRKNDKSICAEVGDVLFNLLVFSMSVGMNSESFDGL